jgi:hypothetical protein
VLTGHLYKDGIRMRNKDREKYHREREKHVNSGSVGLSEEEPERSQATINIDTLVDR